MNRPLVYGQTAKILHWLVAGAIVLQFVLANLAEAAHDNAQSIRELALLANHKSVGITILGLAIIRLLWRFSHPPPLLPAAMPRWQVLASNISHWSLYGLLLLIPITGWLMSSASAYSVSWFNAVQLPDFVAPDPDLKAVFEEVHETLAGLLFVVALVHIAAAVKHAVFDRDGVLARMSSIVSIGLFFGVLVAGLLLLVPTSNGRIAAAQAPTTATSEGSQAATYSAAQTLPAWVIDYGNSSIMFSAEQAGASFTGRWDDWQADIRFDPAALDASTAQVVIKTDSPATGDDERDATLQNAEWFDVRNHPSATFTADQFSATPEGYLAKGHLVVKDHRAPVQLAFNIERDNDTVSLTGNARLDRLQHNIGTGEWLDTSWVGQFVTVTVTVVATLP